MRLRIPAGGMLAELRPGKIRSRIGQCLLILAQRKIHGNLSQDDRKPGDDRMGDARAGTARQRAVDALAPSETHAPGMQLHLP
ncbi:hypothetical protein HHA01_17130 [Halomonas halmophila]|uniref:Uncharacterized protein n=1 Tax=Halomonas halmophila TaxID=252 RepID=A0A4Y4F021_9GAMM|nr:hypothetical protein HHA01_17130 [Halomonas halmophila]